MVERVAPEGRPPEVLAALRREYARGGLTEADVAPDPTTQFRRWLGEAIAAGLTEPNAMVLATAGAEGAPSARTVLLKDVGEAGFTFFTNLGSRKGRELAANPRASLLFPWHVLDRQVTVTGAVVRVPDDAADAYFAARPREAQLGAWASAQSRVIGDRQELEVRLAEAGRRFPGAVPRPAHWGGFTVVPATVEFWQGRPGRLHDRLRYRAAPEGWVLERLAP